MVPADSRFFSFEFVALDFSAPEALQYEYQLEGFDNQWVQSGTRRFLNYTNIPAGQYRFKARLADTPDSEMLDVPLVVQVSFYKTGWFWAVILAGVAALAIGFYRNSTRTFCSTPSLRSEASSILTRRPLPGSSIT